MEKGDISTFTRPTRACLFEGLIASPPPKIKRLFKGNPESNPLKGWTAHDLPLKSLIDGVNRLGIHTLVFTLMGHSYEDPVYRWLVNKGVSCTVLSYDGLDEALQDFKYNRSLHTILVPDQDMAHRIGIRSQVVSTTTAWSQ